MIPFSETSSPRPISRLLAVALLLMVVFAAVIWNQSLVHWRENVLDSYLFGYSGWNVAQGARPYVDIWDNKPPGIWWANAIAFRIAGNGPAADWLVGGGALLVSLLSFVGIAQTLWHGSVVPPALVIAALLLTHISFECGSNRTETLLVMCDLAGVFCYARALRRLNPGDPRAMARLVTWLVAAGVILGFSPWCKQSGVGALAAVCIHCVCSSSSTARGRFGRLSLILLGVLLTQLTAIALLFSHGAAQDALFAILRFNRFYFEVGDASWTNLRGALWAYRDALPPLNVIGWFAVAFTLFAAVRTVARKAKPRGAAASHDLLGFGWIWLLVAGYFTMVGVGRLSYHLMPVLPPLGLILVALVARFSGPAGLVQGVLRRPSLAAYLVLTLAVAWNCASFGFGDAGQCAARRPADAGWLPLTPPPYARQAAEIQRWCEPGDTLYVWGWSPGTYRFSYRVNACRFATLEKMGQLGERVRFIQLEVCRVLREKQPAVIAISELDLAGMRGATETDEFARWVIESYEDRGEIEGMHILRRAK